MRFTCLITLVHVSGVHCHVHASSTAGCAFVYCTVPYGILYHTVVQYLYFKPRMSRSKHKSSWYFSSYSTVRLKVLQFLFLLFMYYLCKKSYKPVTLQCVLAAQSCPTLFKPMDCSPPGSSVHGILQARTLENFRRKLPFPSPGDLSNAGIESGSPALQADSYCLRHWVLCSQLC